MPNTEQAVYLDHCRRGAELKGSMQERLFWDRLAGLCSSDTGQWRTENLGRRPDRVGAGWHAVSLNTSHKLASCHQALGMRFARPCLYADSQKLEGTACPLQNLLTDPSTQSLCSSRSSWPRSFRQMTLGQWRLVDSGGFHYSVLAARITRLAFVFFSLLYIILSQVGTAEENFQTNETKVYSCSS